MISVFHRLLYAWSVPMVYLPVTFFFFSRKNNAFLPERVEAHYFSLSLMSNFKEICTVPTDFGVSFSKFKSEKTGLTVVLADVEGLQ